MIAIAFHITQFSWPLMVLAILSFVFLLWKEWISRDQKLFLLRMITAILVGATMILWTLQPAYWVEKASQSLLLITEAYDPGEVEKWKSAHPDATIWNLMDGSTYLSASKLKKHAIDSIVIAGKGLEADQRNLLQQYPVKMLGMAKYGSIQIKNLHFDPIVIEGDEFHFDLELVSDSAQYLFYTDLNGRNDSTLLPMGWHRVSLQEIAKVEGRYVIPFKARIFEIEIPVQVIKKKQHKILILSSYPSFEFKYLRDQLGKAGHQILSRNGISKDKFAWIHHNRPAQSFKQLSTKWLNEFDFIISDISSLQNLTIQEINSLDTWLSQSLRSVLIIPDLEFGQLILPQHTLKLEKGKSEKPLSFEWETTRFPLAATTIKMKNSASVRTSASRLFDYQYYGLGTLAVLRFSESYPLLLQGHNAAYTALWSTILKELIKTAPKEEWSIPFPMIVNTDIQIQYQTKGLEDPNGLVIQRGSQSWSISSNQDPNVTSLHWAKWKAPQAGWMSSKANNSDSEHYFYISDSEAITYYHFQEFFKQNLAFFDNPRPYNSSKIQVKTEKKVGNILFFFILLTGLSILWLLPRI